MRYSKKERDDIRKQRLEYVELFDGGKGMRVVDIAKKYGVSTGVVQAGFKAIRVEKENAEKAKEEKLNPTTLCVPMFWDQKPFSGEAVAV